MGIWLEIFDDIMNHELELFFIILLVVLLFVVFIRKIKLDGIDGFISYFDPLIIGLIFGELTAFIVPIFMYIRGWMYDDKFIVSYLMTEILLFFGFFLGSGIKLGLKKVNKKQSIDIPVAIRKNIYISVILFFFLIRILYFYKVGIPAFSDKYYTTLMAESTFLSRLSISFYLIVCMLWLDSLSYIKTKINYIIGLGIILIFILSAQKGLILYLLFAIFFMEVYKLKTNREVMRINKKVASILLVVVFSMVMLPLIVQAQNHDNWNPFLMFVIRVMGNGDSFPLFYGLRSTEEILYEHTGVWEFIWANLSVFTVDFGYNSNYIPNMVLKDLVGVYGEEFVSPIIRHNIIGIKMFGDYGACIYSLIIGFIIGGITRYLLLRMSNFNIYIYIIYSNLYLGVTHFVENYIVLGNLDSVLVDSFVIYILYRLFFVLLPSDYNTGYGDVK